MKHLFRAALTALLALIIFGSIAHSEDKQKSFPFTAEEDTDGSRYVWFVYGKSGMAYPYIRTPDIPKSELFMEHTGGSADPGLIVWWPNYMALYARDKQGRPVIYGAQRSYPVGELDKLFGKPRFFTFVQKPAHTKVPGEKELNWAEEQVEHFARYAQIYPPDVTGAEELEKVRSEWKKTEPEFAALAAEFPDSYEIRLRAGNFYRYGNNLDLGSYEEGRTNLYKAITLSPMSPSAYIDLATLFYTSEPGMAQAAEFLLNEAMKVDDSEATAKRALPGLFFASWYQGDLKAAVTYADYYLTRWPGDEQMMKLRETALAAIEEANKKK